MNRREYQRAIRELASFRYKLRKLLHFGEIVPREHGITPRQYQLILGVAGFTGRGSATISELAEFLQERHNSVVGLVDRAERGGLVRRESGSADRRVVLVSLTPRGEETLARISLLHRKEVERLKQELSKIESGRKPSRCGISSPGAEGLSFLV